MWQAADRRYSAEVGQEQIEIVERALDAWNRGDVEAMVADAAPDSEYAIDQRNPNARLLQGRAEIADYLRDWHETVHGLRYELAELRDCGESVLVLGTMSGRAGGEDGPEITAELAFILYFDGTVVVRTEEYLDVRDALAAAGLS
jgi:ketosteroid isomerase-like protein